MLQFSKLFQSCATAAKHSPMATMCCQSATPSGPLDTVASSDRKPPLVSVKPKSATPPFLRRDAMPKVRRKLAGTHFTFWNRVVIFELADAEHDAEMVATFLAQNYCSVEPSQPQHAAAYEHFHKHTASRPICLVAWEDNKLIAVASSNVRSHHHNCNASPSSPLHDDDVAPHLVSAKAVANHEAIAVHEDYRKCGLATQMLLTNERIARAQHHCDHAVAFATTPLDIALLHNAGYNAIAEANAPIVITMHLPTASEDVTRAKVMHKKLHSKLRGHHFIG